MLEKYLNIQDCLEKSSKFKFPRKVLDSHKNAWKSIYILPFTGEFNNVFGDLNQYKVFLQTVKTQMKCSIMLHFIIVYTVCKGKKEVHYF